MPEMAAYLNWSFFWVRLLVQEGMTASSASIELGKHAGEIRVQLELDPLKNDPKGAFCQDLNTILVTYFYFLTVLVYI